MWCKPAQRPQGAAPGELPDIRAVACGVVRLSPYATVLRIRLAALPAVKTVSLLARCRACYRGFSEPCTRQRGFSWLASSRASAYSFKFIVKLCRSLSTPRRPTTARRGLTLRSSGAPTACHQARATVQVCIFCSAGLASRRRRPLTSNVRPHKTPGCRVRVLHQAPVD